MSHRLLIVLALVAIASALPTEIKSKNTKPQTEEKKIHNPKLTAKPVPVVQNEYKGRYDLEDENVKIVPVAIVTDDGPVPIMTQFLREKRQYGGGQRPGPPPRGGGGQRRPYPHGPGSQGHYQQDTGSPFDSPSSGGGSYGSERRPGGPPGSYGQPQSSYGRPGESSSGQGGSYGGPESSPSHGTHLSFTAGGPPSSGQRHPGQHGSSPYEHSNGSQGGNPFGSGGPYQHQQYEGQEYSPQGGGPPSGYPSQGSEYSPGGSPYGGRQ